MADEPQGGQTPPEGQEPKPEPKAEAETPPPSFDAEYVKKLRDEAAGYRKRAQEAEAKNQEHEDANASEIEKLTKRADREKERADEAAAGLLRFEVAAEKKVPTELTSLLTGSTREELEGQAQLLLDNLSAAKKTDFDGGAREPAPESKTPEQEHNEFVAELLTGKAQDQ